MRPQWFFGNRLTKEQSWEEHRLAAPVGVAAGVVMMIVGIIGTVRSG